jgi:hypothetical protein
MVKAKLDAQGRRRHLALAIGKQEGQALQARTACFPKP